MYLNVSYRLTLLLSSFELERGMRMKKPYIVCHMMTSVDGRIDCAMTEHLPGVQEYYAALDELDAPTRVSGRVTAQLEMAKPGTFRSERPEPIGKEAFAKHADANGYEIVADTRGTLLWDGTEEDGRPLLILTCEQVSRDYLDYLDRLNISWIACGKERIDLNRACEILAETFGVERMAVVGGGRISYYLTQRLLASGIKVKILEQDPVRAEHLARLLPKAAVVLGDGSSQEVLEREGLDESDALVTLTGMDEENIVISMYGHAMGVCKVVTKVNRLEYSNMFSDLGVGSLVIPKELCSASIVRYVRAMNNKQTGSVLTLHRIANGLVEALEFRVDANVRWRDTPLKDVPLKQGVLISCITRQGEMTIPDGTSVFRQGDTVVVVVTASDNTFLQMNDIFEA